MQEKNGTFYIIKFIYINKLGDVAAVAIATEAAQYFKWQRDGDRWGELGDSEQPRKKSFVYLWKVKYLNMKI